MLLVFLCFIILSLLLISLRFEMEIENFTYSNINKQVPDNLMLKIRIFLINKLKIIEINLNKEKLKKIYSKQKYKQIDTKKIIKKLPKSNKESLKLLNIFEIKKLYLILEIGTEEIMFTTLAIPIIASIISFILLKNSKATNNNYYKIKPLYVDRNVYKINFNCIISIKMIHIINIMWEILRKRDEKNERTSDRRSYAYSNE